MKKREQGYYWVDPQSLEGEWFIGYWDGDFERWTVAGLSKLGLCDRDIANVGSHKIVMGCPGKPPRKVPENGAGVPELYVIRDRDRPDSLIEMSYWFESLYNGIEGQEYTTKAAAIAEGQAHQEALEYLFGMGDRKPLPEFPKWGEKPSRGKPDTLGIEWMVRKGDPLCKALPMMKIERLPDESIASFDKRILAFVEHGDFSAGDAVEVVIDNFLSSGILVVEHLTGGGGSKIYVLDTETTCIGISRACGFVLLIMERLVFCFLHYPKNSNQKLMKLLLRLRKANAQANDSVEKGFVSLRVSSQMM